MFMAQTLKPCHSPFDASMHSKTCGALRKDKKDKKDKKASWKKLFLASLSRNNLLLPGFRVNF